MATFDKKDTYDKTIAVIAAKLSVDPATIPDDAVWDEIGIDSVDFVAIIMALEEEFSISIDDEKVEKLKKLSEFIDYLHELRLKGKNT